MTAKILKLREALFGACVLACVVCFFGAVIGFTRGIWWMFDHVTVGFR